MFRTANQRLIDLFRDYYGMMPNTWKDICFKKRYELYKTYRGAKVTDYIMEKLKDIVEEFPYVINEKWIRQKYIELLGGELCEI